MHVQKGSKVKVGDPLLTVEGGPAHRLLKNQRPKARPVPRAQAAEKTPPRSRRPPSRKPLRSRPRRGDETQEPRSRLQRRRKSPPRSAPKPKAKSKPASKAKAAAAAVEPVEKPRGHKTPPAGPATRRLARELGVDLAQVDGTGPHGRITEDDVKAAVREHTTVGPASGSSHACRAAARGCRRKGSPGACCDVRRCRAFARRSPSTWPVRRSTIPHVTNFDDADITELERIRKGGMSDYVGTEVKLTMMAFVMKAVAQSLKLHPMVNASVDMENEAGHLQAIRQHRRGRRHRTGAGRAGDPRRRPDEHSAHRPGADRR